MPRPRNSNRRSESDSTAPAPAEASLTTFFANRYRAPTHYNFAADQWGYADDWAVPDEYIYRGPDNNRAPETRPPRRRRARRSGNNVDAASESVPAATTAATAAQPANSSSRGGRRVGWRSRPGSASVWAVDPADAADSVPATRGNQTARSNDVRADQEAPRFPPSLMSTEMPPVGVLRPQRGGPRGGAASVSVVAQSGTRGSRHPRRSTAGAGDRPRNRTRPWSPSMHVGSEWDDPSDRATNTSAAPSSAAQSASRGARRGGRNNRSGRGRPATAAATLNRGWLRPVSPATSGPTLRNIVWDIASNESDRRPALDEDQESHAWYLPTNSTYGTRGSNDGTPTHEWSPSPQLEEDDLWPTYYDVLAAHESWEPSIHGAYGRWGAAIEAEAVPQAPSPARETRNQRRRRARASASNRQQQQQQPDQYYFADAINNLREHLEAVRFVENHGFDDWGAISDEDFDLELPARECEEAKEARIKKARDVDYQKDTIAMRYTRACGICTTPNPRIRFALTACGHIICAPCVEQVEKANRNHVYCPYCRAISGFVRLYETLEEEGPFRAGAEAPEVAQESK